MGENVVVREKKEVKRWFEIAENSELERALLKAIEEYIKHYIPDAEIKSIKINRVVIDYDQHISYQNGTAEEIRPDSVIIFGSDRQ